MNEKVNIPARERVKFCPFFKVRCHTVQCVFWGEGVCNLAEGAKAYVELSGLEK